VNALWLLDLEEFNEWMNEEDYLVEDDEVCCSSADSTNLSQQYNIFSNRITEIVPTC